MTDKGPEPTPSSPAQEQTISAAANGKNTVKLNPCLNGSPCLVCWLRQKVAEQPETKSFTSFRTAELDVNILGVRRQDSVTDSFDDFMVVFFKPVAPEHKEAFERVVEQDLRDDWKTIHGKSQKFSRVVPCTKDNVSWIVSVYSISTDPGLTDYPEEKAAKSKKATEKAITDKKAKLADLDAQLAQAKKDAAAKKAAHDALPADPPAKTKGAKGPKAKALADCQVADKKVEKLQKSRDQTQAQVDEAVKKDKEAGDALKKADDNAKKRDPIAVLGSGDEGGLEPGRAMVPCGAYPDQFTFFVHHAGGAGSKFPKGHVALCVGMIDQGYRFYSVDYLKREAPPADDNVDTVSATIAGKDPETRSVVGELVPGGQKPSEKFEGTKAQLAARVDAQGARKLTLYVDGKERALGEKDVIALRAQIGGTNLHRGHNAKVDDGDKVIQGRAGGDKVKGFSEGCQVNPSFDSYNQFIRLAAISKRWTCKKDTKGETPECARLVAGSGEALGAGEKAMLERFGKTFINTATLAAMGSDLGSQEEAVKALEAKKKAAEAKKPSTWTSDDEAELKKATAKRDGTKEAIADLKSDSANEAKKAEAKKAIKDAEKAIRAEEKAIEAAKALNAKKPKPKTDEEMKPTLKPLEDKKAAAEAKKKKAEADLEAAEKAQTLRKDAIAARKELLNERTRFFRGDFFRECDLPPGGGAKQCSRRFTYVLIELDDAGCDDLEQRFEASRNKSWNGDLVLSGE